MQPGIYRSVCPTLFLSCRPPEHVAYTIEDAGKRRDASTVSGIASTVQTDCDSAVVGWENMPLSYTNQSNPESRLTLVLNRGETWSIVLQIAPN